MAKGGIGSLLKTIEKCQVENCVLGTEFILNVGYEIHPQYEYL